MIRAMRCDASGPVEFDVPVDSYHEAIRDTDRLLWVDFQGEPNERSEPILSQTFKFHPLAIDDALRETHVPKVDDWGDYLYLVLESVVYIQDPDDPLDVRELDIFLGRNYLVTHHDLPIPAIEQLWERLHRDDRLARKGAGYLLYEMIDTLVANILPIVDEMDQTLEDVEDLIFTDPDSEVLEKIFMLKRGVIQLRRVIAPQREVVNKLARDSYPVMDIGERIYFRDVYDHLVRSYEINEGMRDQATGALETYLSVINNRMNDVMKTLTIITTLFMPLSFLVGFFGMNFFQPAGPSPMWTGQPALVLALAVMVLSPLAMYLYARARKWL
ncbi:MAG: magnesium/cobalt transporter CorA [Anaerolineales bacterium]|jgi:magnesium transporter